MSNPKVVNIMHPEALEADLKANLEHQIEVARKYPREVNKALANIKNLATQSQKTAQEMFYALERKKKDGTKEIITGASVRMAEIVAHCWGNLRIVTRIIGNDGNIVKAQAACWDMENNVAISREVDRSIRTKDGEMYSNDMIITTMMAAQSIAFRNGVLSIVPEAMLESIYEDINKVALGDGKSFEELREGIVHSLVKLGVPKPNILQMFERSQISELDRNEVIRLKHILNSHEQQGTDIGSFFGIKIHKALPSGQDKTKNTSTFKGKGSDKKYFTPDEE